MHLLGRLGSRGKERLRSFDRTGKERQQDFGAAVRRASVYVPEPMYEPDELLALALVAEEERDGIFSEARNWVSELDHYASGYLPELRSIVESPQPPSANILDTLEPDGPRIGEYLTAFREAVNKRVLAIDHLFYHPVSEPTGSLKEAPARPPGSSSLPALVIDVTGEVKQIVQPPGSAPPDILRETPASIAHGRVDIPAPYKVATVFNVLIASPGDTHKDREIVETAIHDWNRKQQHRTRKVILLPQRWERDTIPRIGRGDGQQEVNRQLADRSDIAFALFRNQLGSPTARYASGTVEEIELSLQRGIPVHAFASDSHTGVRVSKLTKYLASLRDRGLLGSYSDDDSLYKTVSEILERDVSELLGDSAE